MPWNIADYSSTTINTILADPGASLIQDGVNRIVSYDGDNYLQVSSEAPFLHNEASLELARPSGGYVGVTTQFTFQFEFRAPSLPVDLNELDKKRIFVAIYDRQQDTAGLLFSQNGIAWASTADGIPSISPVPGSSALIEEDLWYTVRMVVDGNANWMYIYITPTSVLASTGHILRYQTSSVPTTVILGSDALRVEAFGLPGAPSDIRVREFLAATGLLIPNKPPVAKTNRDCSVQTGRKVVLDARESYDPEGADLTYEWKLFDAPYESKFVTSKTDGRTPPAIGPVIETDVFITETYLPELEFLRAGDIIKVGDRVGVISPSSFGSSGELISSNRLLLTEPVLVTGLSNQEWFIYHSACIGNPTADLTYAKIDAPGPFSFRLMVNDGDLDSHPAYLLVQGYQGVFKDAGIPDYSFIWKCLGSDWSYVGDKTKITAAWDAFSLVAAGFLLQLWQINANRSLGTIPRRRLKKWVGIDGEIPKEKWNQVDLNYFYPPVYSELDASFGFNVVDKSLQLFVNATEYNITFTGVGAISASSVVSQINSALPITLAGIEEIDSTLYLKLEYSGYFYISDESTALSDLGFDPNGFGNVLTGGNAYLQTPDKSDKLVRLDTSQPLELDKIPNITSCLLVTDDSIHRIGSVTGPRTLLLSDPFPTGNLSWAILPTVRLTGFNSEDYHLCGEDKLQFSFTGKVGDSRIIHVPCGGGIGPKVSYDPTGWGEYYKSDVLVELEKIVKLQYVPLLPETVSIPLISTSVENPELVLTEHKHFRVIDSKWLYFNEIQEPVQHWWAEHYYLNNEQAVEDNFGHNIKIYREDLVEIDYLASIQGLYYAYFKGPVFNTIQLAMQILFNLPFAEVKGTIIDINEEYTAKEIQILVQDDDGSGNIRSYLFLRNATIAINPETGEKYKVGDTVQPFAVLCSGITLMDYLSLADWLNVRIAQGASYEVNKFHTFGVGADVDLVLVENIPLVLAFLKRAKPTYTDFIVALRKFFTDEIDINDDVTKQVGVHLYENVSSLADGGSRKIDDYDGSGECLGEADAFWTSGIFRGADSIQPAGKRSNVWEPIIASPTSEELAEALIEWATAFNGHLTAAGAHYTDPQMLVDVPATLGSITETIHLVRTLKKAFNDHDNNIGGSYHTDFGNHQMVVSVYDIISVINSFNEFKQRFADHIVDVAHNAHVHIPVHSPDLIYQEGWDQFEVPFLEGKNWAELPDPITELDGQTLELEVAAEPTSAHLLVATGFNDSGAHLEYLRGTDSPAPTGTYSATTTEQWAGAGALYMDSDEEIEYDLTNTFTDQLGMRGEVCFRWRPGPNLFTLTSGSRDILNLYSASGNDNRVHCYLTRIGGVLPRIRILLRFYHDAGSYSLRTVDILMTEADNWHEVSIRWDLHEQYLVFSVNHEVRTLVYTSLRAVGVWQLVLGGAGDHQYYMDNLRIYDKLVHGEDHYLPPAEEYYNPGVQIVTFGLGDAQDAIDAINEVCGFPSAFLKRYESGAIHPVIQSRDQRISVVGGTALNTFGFTAGQTEHLICKYSITGNDISGGLDVDGLEFIVEIEGVEHTVTFAGANPISGADIISQINTETSLEFARWAGNYLKVSHPFKYRIKNGNANEILGFSSGVSRVDFYDVYVEIDVEAEWSEDYGSGLSFNDVIDAMNLLRASYSNHISNNPQGYHGIIDVTNVLVLPSLTYSSTILDVMDVLMELRAEYNAHDSNNGYPYHGVFGTHQIPIVAYDTTWSDITVMYASMVAIINAHMLDA